MAVWIANRNDPILGYDGGYLSLDNAGTMQIIRQGGEPLILYSPSEDINKTKAILLDTGNFVLQELDPDRSVKSVLWQSFDYSTDLLLPGMELGVDHRTGETSSLVSYLTSDIPSSGASTLEWDPKRGELIIQRRGQIYWASGVLRNQRFEYIPEETQAMNRYTVVSNEDEEYFSYTLWSQPTYRHVGEIFESETVNLRNVDASNFSFVDENVTTSDCKAICWENCSCVGFASLSDGGTGCVFYNVPSYVKFLDANNSGDSFFLLETSREHRRKSILNRVMLGVKHLIRR
ncbi:G-type lectin S-receptor-like serine/threonine-protein kinase At1g67520 [Prosopis cineraria]|uniref:G-type lectin S-receptor-like serine/threonine-protein kinase At1g67520 n=1 Tax=Prosopis cineraria TaxID=364024 RepID=UPI0024100C46|nr:G-type lectin S-receptor-like serine/threonine-protein kinase At1g67520 [Prosopis cineraria]